MDLVEESDQDSKRMQDPKLPMHNQVYHSQQKMS